MRKTKIICTIGPASESAEMVEKLICSGMNVARLNFSHENHEVHEKRMNIIKEVRSRLNKPVAILLDTKGPEIRIKSFKDGRVELKKGGLLTLKHDDIEGTPEEVSITCKNLYEDVSVGTKILIDDGLIEMKVVELKGKDIVCEIINGGMVSNNKGVNVPDVHLSLPYLSEKDKSDIIFGVEQDVDFVAASFVRTAEDVKQIRDLLFANGGKNVEIISKIENEEGVNNIEEIIDASDAIMIARGDMGVEIPFEEVPAIQKMIIKKAYLKGKKVITATQMLDSMMKNPRPTRAETTDVANAVYDGTSAIMLSGETAAGSYPIEALEAMDRIAVRTEKDIDYRKRFFQSDRPANPDITDAICHATCTTALDLYAKAIISVTKTGMSARMVSRYKPMCGIIACSSSEKVCRQLNLAWGVTPILIEEKTGVLDLFGQAVSAAEERKLVQKNDTVVITAGVPLGISGSTNMIKVAVV